MTVTELENAIEMEEFIPTGLTRCDQCPNYCSRAYVRYIKGKLELMFCKHHSDVNELALMSSNWLKQDKTSVLVAECEAYKKVSSDDDKF